MQPEDATPFRGSRAGFDVHYSANDLLLEDCLIDGGVKPQPLGPLYSFQSDDDVRNGPPSAPLRKLPSFLLFRALGGSKQHISRRLRAAHQLEWHFETPASISACYALQSDKLATNAQNLQR